MGRQVKRAFRYRFHPTNAQTAELSRTFGCVRLVYNRALQERTRAYRDEGRRVSYADSSAMLTEWKRTEELAFLGEVSCVPSQQAPRHLQGAFMNFWGRLAEYPTFKSKKKSRASAEYTRSGFRLRNGLRTLAKMSEPLDIAWSRPLPEGAQPSTVTVSRDAAGRWFVSLLCDDTITTLPPTDTMVGIDAGPTSLVTLSTGEKIADPRHERRHRRRLAKAQRASSRKAKGSRNREKARRMVALARAISDAAWRQMRGMLEYKTAWYGRNLIVVDRWYPSSKLCSACGRQAAAMPLSVRARTCTCCGTTHDRDANAARNLLAAGLAES
ncbi:putative transposase [Actinocorallia herbida]|uniref:Putative transposase n=1 Tax=Actinocorallia herbida TaxID=58109 RepID=A0A3N1D848_9ACTN|nr:RNA-guided endonuclease TnpB family protein [Actinocorallia herbida]ROO89666.1 putative transposase [Actinocorallia herbida]